MVESFDSMIESLYFSLRERNKLDFFTFLPLYLYIYSFIYRDRYIYTELYNNYNNNYVVYGNRFRSVDVNTPFISNARSKKKWCRIPNVDGINTISL